MFNNWKIRTKIGASFATGLSLICAIGITAYYTTNRLIENTAWQNHTYIVMGKLDDLMSQLKETSIGPRGYIITGNKSYLDPYKAAIPVIAQDLNSLQELTIDNLSQQRRIETLKPIVSRRIAIVDNTISIRETQGFSAAQQLIMINNGKK